MKRSALVIAISLFSAVSRADSPPIKAAPPTKETVAYFDGTASLATSTRDLIHGSLAFRIYNDDGPLRAYRNKAYFDAARFFLLPGANKFAQRFIGTLGEDGVAFDYRLSRDE